MTAAVLCRPERYSLSSSGLYLRQEHYWVWMVEDGGQGQWVCLLLLLQPFWLVHPPGIHSGK